MSLSRAFKDILIDDLVCSISFSFSSSFIFLDSLLFSASSVAMLYVAYTVLAIVKAMEFLTVCSSILRLCMTVNLYLYLLLNPLI